MALRYGKTRHIGCTDWGEIWYGKARSAKQCEYKNALITNLRLGGPSNAAGKFEEECSNLRIEYSIFCGQTKPEFSVEASKASFVVSPDAIEILTAVFTSLKHLKNNYIIINVIVAVAILHIAHYMYNIAYEFEIPRSEVNFVTTRLSSS